MTPVVSWSPADFYAAVDRARWAWQQTNPQMVLTGWTDALDELDGDGQRPALKLVERVPSRRLTSVPLRDALTSGADPGCGPLPGDETLLAAADTFVVSSAPSSSRGSSRGERASLDLTLVPGSTPGCGSHNNDAPGDANLWRVARRQGQEGA